MESITPYLIKFSHQIETTGQTTIAATNPEDAAKGAEILLRKFGIENAKIIAVTEYEDEEVTIN